MSLRSPKFLAKAGMFIAVMTLAVMACKPPYDPALHRDNRHEGANKVRAGRALPGRMVPKLDDTVDWWYLEVAAKSSAMVMLNISNNLCDLDLYLHDGTGRLLAQSATKVGSTFEKLNAQVDKGLYYVRVTAPKRSPETAYTLQVTVRPEDPEAASGADKDKKGATAFKGGEKVSGEVCYPGADRSDWWAVEIDQASQLTAVITKGNQDLEQNILGEIDMAGNLTAIDGEGSAIMKPGTHHIRVYAQDFNDCGQYTLTTTLEPFDADANSGADRAMGGALELQAGQAGQDSIDYDGGDATDHWKITVTKSGSMTVKFAPEKEGPLACDLLGADGSPIKTGFTSSASAGVKPGDYYVKCYGTDFGAVTPYAVSYSFAKAKPPKRGEIVEIEASGGKVRSVIIMVKGRVRKGARGAIKDGGRVVSEIVITEVFGEGLYRAKLSSPARGLGDMPIVEVR